MKSEIDVPVFVIVGFQDWTWRNTQQRIKDVFKRLPVLSAQCEIEIKIYLMQAFV